MTELARKAAAPRPIFSSNDNTIHIHLLIHINLLIHGNLLHYLRDTVATRCFDRLGPKIIAEGILFLNLADVLA